MNRRALLKSLAGAVGASVVPAPKTPVDSLWRKTLADAAACPPSNLNPLFSGDQIVCVFDRKTGLASIYSYTATPDNRLEVTKVLP